MPGVPVVGDLKLNSYYVELGEISFMKEVIAYQVRVRHSSQQQQQQPAVLARL
jgi:hypothetical protein